MRQVLILLSFLSNFFFVCCTSSWGFQESGSFIVISFDSEGYVYSTGTESSFPYRYFVHKISSNGESIWKYVHPSPSSSLSEFSPSGITVGPSSVYVYGHTEKMFIHKINKEDGKFIWERLDFIKPDFYSWTNFYYGITDQDDNPYILFHSQKRWTYQDTDEIIIDRRTNQDYEDDDDEMFQNNVVIKRQLLSTTNDYVIKLDGETSNTTWQVACTVDVSNSNLYSVFSIIELSTTSTTEFVIKGRYYNNYGSKQMSIMNTMSLETGELISESIIDPYEDPARYEFHYKTNSYYASGASHLYGTDESLKGYVITKNSCEDGYYFSPHTKTTSIPKPCPGFTWSLPKPLDDQLTCNYYYGRVNVIGVILLYLFPIFLITGISYQYNLSSVHILSSILGSLVFSTDVSYLLSMIFYNLLLFSLALVFNLLPSIHLLKYFFEAKKNRSVKYFFNPPEPFTPFIAISSRDGGVPYFRDIRCIPNSVKPSEDLLYLIGGWIGASFVQILYWIIWLIFHIIPTIPWLIVHLPWFFIMYIWGYILYRTGLLQHHIVKEQWFKLIFHSPSSYPMEGDIETRNNNNDNNNNNNNNEIESVGTDIRPSLKTNDASSDLIASSISILFLGIVGLIIIEYFNDKRMHSFGLLSGIAIVTKSLFIANIINRISVVYGPIIIPYIRMKCSTIFPSYNYFLSLMELELYDANQSTSPSSSPSPSSQLQLQSQPQSELQYINQINELQNEIQYLRSQLARYQEIDPSAPSISSAHFTIVEESLNDGENSVNKYNEDNLNEIEMSERESYH